MGAGPGASTAAASGPVVGGVNPPAGAIASLNASGDVYKRQVQGLLDRVGQFTDAIQKALNVSYDEAEALKLGGGCLLYTSRCV